MNEELKVIISAEVDKLRQGIDKAKQQVKTLQDKFKEASKTIKEDLAAAGESATNVAKKIGAGFAAIGAALVATAASTEEYRNQQAQLITAFEMAGGSAEQAKETYNELYRVLGDGGAATEAAQHLAKLTTSEEGLEVATGVLKGVYATFGSSLPLEGLAEAWNHTAQLGEVQGALADALEWSGVNVDEFNKRLAAATTQGEREYILNEQLIDLYWDAGEAYEQNNAKILAQRDAQAKLQETLAKVGEAIAPVITAFTQLANDALAAITPYITQLAEKYMPKLQDVLAKVGEAVGKLINWISSNWGIISTIAEVVLAIVAAFTAYNAVMKLVNAANALFAMNPIVLAIGAIIAIIVVCVKHWDDIKAAAVKAWEGIKAAWGKVGDWFKGIVDKIKLAFANIGDWFKNLFSNAWNGIKNAWSGVKQWFSDLWNGIKNIYSAVGGWFSNIFTNAKTFIQNAFSGITGFFSGIWEKIKSIFANVGTAIANGIKGAVSTAVNKVLSTACKIINGFIGAINFAIDIINAIPGVNIGRLNTLSVPQMAKGGIVDSATLAVIGEQGKEAVVPLENNLQWLDKLAGMLNDRMGGNQPIVINVDGKRFGEIAVDTINGITRQRGSIPLVIA